ncbi:MAG: hypothetical protein K6U11_02440 [bacterium]|nr:hypothetical protein [bacterium]
MKKMKYWLRLIHFPYKEQDKRGRSPMPGLTQVLGKIQGKLWIVALSMLILLAAEGVLWCSSHHIIKESGHIKESAHSELITTLSHNSDQGEINHHSTSIPVLYKLYWIGLIIMVVLMVGYFFFLHPKEKYQFIKPLTIIFILLALSLYLIEQGRVFTGYFDPSAGGRFVSGYHENNEIGFLRFVYKLTLGMALWAFGFITYQVRLKNKKSAMLAGGTKVRQGEGE